MFPKKPASLLILTTLILFLMSSACSGEETVAVPASSGAAAAHIESLPGRPTPSPVPWTQVTYDPDHTDGGLFLHSGGDVDTVRVTVGSPPEYARRTGNGTALFSRDRNRVADSYMQFDVDDGFIYGGSPTSRVQIEIEYFDEGTDTFTVQYDAISGGPYGNGQFKSTNTVVKTDSGAFKTAVFSLCDAYFANRDNGADFRIDDRGDGAETIRRVIVTRSTLGPGPATIHVDSCGANPFDDQPDSDSIQACVDQACSGDTVLFTSGVNSPGYQGYVIDKTVYLARTSAKSDLTFSSTDPANHALLRASPDLLGFVVKLYARSSVGNPGDVDDVTVSHLDLDGNRAQRKCVGADGSENGIDDNCGSWLVGECIGPDDPWCSAGTLSMTGAMDWDTTTQDYALYPERWSTGLVVDDVHISQSECAATLDLSGADGIIRDTTIDTAGDHVHVAGCSHTDVTIRGIPDDAVSDWADGITLMGPGHLVTGNTIINASDVGIVHFGGVDTIISNNTIIATAGNYGMFAGILIGPSIHGDISGGQVVSNTVINQADETCGGIHAGIVIGPHMWRGGCEEEAVGGQIGTHVVTVTQCVDEPPQPFGARCTGGESCQVWAHVAVSSTFTLKDNYVAGAQVNYLVEGLDLVGTFVESNNRSGPPRMTDWESAKAGCPRDNGPPDTWGTLDRVAHHPTLPGWTDQRIHCER
jgi:hypothetical protein